MTFYKVYALPVNRKSKMITIFSILPYRKMNKLIIQKVSVV